MGHASVNSGVFKPEWHRRIKSSTCKLEVHKEPSMEVSQARDVNVPHTLVCVDRKGVIESPPTLMLSSTDSDASSVVFYHAVYCRVS